MTDAVLSAPSSVEVLSASPQTATSSASPPRLPTRRAICTARCNTQLATRDDFVSSLLDLSILHPRKERLTRHVNVLRRLLALLSDPDRTLSIIPICLGTSKRVYRALWDSGSQGDFVHPRVVEEARLVTSGSRSPIFVTLGDNKTQRFFDQTVPDLHFSLTLQPSDSTQTPRRYHSSAYFDVLETGYDFLLGTPWSRRFRSTEAEWATETLVLKTKCGQTLRVPFIGITGDTLPDLPPQDPRPSGSHPDIAFTSPRQFAHFIRQEDATFYSVNVMDLLRYDSLCPEVELISLEPDPPDPPSIFAAPISTSTRQSADTPSTSHAPAPSTVESTHTSHADTDAEELTRFTTDLESAVRDLIREYHDVFPPYFSYSGIPPMRGVEHSIQLVPDYHVHHQTPYRLSISKVTELNRQLEELLRLGFIKPSNSPWGAPVLFAHEADETLRLFINYRGLNRYTVKNNYLMPRADELFDRLAGNRFFTKIDLCSGYHQIRVATEDQPKTAFRSRFGHYKFTVMPFGPTNAPATFQTATDDIFRDIFEEYVLVYLDDILVYSRTLEDHLRHLRDVLQRLRKHGFYAKLNTRCPALDDWIAHMAAIMKRAHESLADSQTRMAARANGSRMDHPFKVGDDVLVDARHLQLEADTLCKFKRRFFGPCRMLQAVGSDTAASPVSFRVKLPDYPRQACVQDVYHVSLPRPYRRPSERFAGRPYERPPPIMVDGHKEFVVPDIVSRQVTDDTHPRIKYLVRWKGYPDEEATWEPLEHLQHARMLVRAYDRARRAEMSARAQLTDPVPPPPAEEIAEDEPAPSEAVPQPKTVASKRPQRTHRRPSRYDD
ncbi:hypothetical protein CBR_g23381 [Chara braunii]|uniref:Chromo domain-containing protein n=1 Tax=Chara braunii TaxID=69332 RepID=A0A388L420_CHABU|nr:hypothetical protein CBR_g23381 [Chara braunii]|eukprot:GBG77055.1 hypothetical protein CBR_g23381 [Chara braunii]